MNRTSFFGFFTLPPRVYEITLASTKLGNIYRLPGSILVRRYSQVVTRSMSERFVCALLVLFSNVRGLRPWHLPRRALSQSQICADRGGKAEWAGEGGSSGPKLREIDQLLLSKLDTTLGQFMTKVAIDTQGHYMLEFHNDIDQRWMKQFRNYSSSGFSEAGGWTDWLECMINMDKTSVQVLMNPPKALMRGRRQGFDYNVRLEYLHDIEPRKIAHQILTVRESCVEELIQDLGCVRTENEEAMRYAQQKLEAGVDVAEKERKVTRMSETDTQSTPLRDRSFLELDIIVTNFALEQVRIDLAKQSDNLGVKYLDDVFLELEKKDEKRSVLERVLHEFYAPRELIENLCFNGLQQGVDRSSGLNALKIAESVLLTRYSVALEANKILLDHDRYCRNYYKLIRDKGGISTWKDATKKAKVRIIDLDVEDKLETEQEKSAAATAKEAEVSLQRAQEAARAQAASDAAKAEAQRAADVAAEAERLAAEMEQADFDVGDIRQGGPMLM